MSKELSTDKEIDRFDIISGADFIERVNKIIETVENCSINDLKSIFANAMKYSNAEQDMSKFEPMNTTYIELFKRQIRGAAMQLSYDDLDGLYNYVKRLEIEKEERKTRA
jgi:hypothetical protein